MKTVYTQNYNTPNKSIIINITLDDRFATVIGADFDNYVVIALALLLITSGRHSMIYV